MKLKAITLALLLAGAGSSYALAGGGHGNDKGTKAKEHAAGTAPDDESTTSRESTTAEAPKQKVVLCHKAGKSGHVVRISVSSNAVKAHSRHGDLAPAADGTCAAPRHPGTTTTTGSTTTVHTTTAASGH